MLWTLNILRWVNVALILNAFLANLDMRYTLQVTLIRNFLYEATRFATHFLLERLLALARKHLKLWVKVLICHANWIFGEHP